MDNEIIKALSSLLDEKLEPIKNQLNSLEKKVDGVVDQTADLLEFRSDISEQMKQVKGDVGSIKKDITNVEVITASNWQDIAKLKAVK